MKNQETKKISLKEKKGKAQDDANLASIKKGSSKDAPTQSRSSLYKGMDDLSIKDQKKERSKIRRRLDNFISDILGMDRKKEEKESSIKEFNSFYKKNWKIQDFKIDNFSNQSDEDKRKEFTLILDLAKKSLHKD